MSKEKNQSIGIKPENKEAKLDASSWPLLLKVTFSMRNNII